MMKNKKTLIYIFIIIFLLVILGLLWYLIITNNGSSNTGNTPPGINSSSVEYSAVKEITKDEDISRGEYKSTKADENAILISGNIKSTLSGIKVNKTGDSDGGDNTSFYGTNSGILAKSGANVTIKNAEIITNAKGANGVFSYGGSATTNNSNSDGTTVNISDSKITTKKDNSGGIMTTGGGIMNATNLTVDTSGTSSAAIRSDRGGGTVTVNKGTYTTSGKGSPVIYSTADITVKNAKLISKASEGVVIEGKKTSKAVVKLKKYDKKTDKSTVELIIHEGRNHQVKKMFEAINHDVIKLKRETYANLDLTGLLPGEYRKLTNKEVAILYSLIKK